jgi:NAD-dependent SIR2 family protein deacetylase
MKLTDTTDSQPALDIQAIAQKIKSGGKIVTMAGAGMSVSAGIPDFRTPGTGESQKNLLVVSFSFSFFFFFF